MSEAKSKHRWAVGGLSLVIGATLAAGAHAAPLDMYGDETGIAEIGPPIGNPHAGDPDLTNGGRRPTDTRGRDARGSGSRSMSARRGQPDGVVRFHVQVALNVWRVFWLHR